MFSILLLDDEPNVLSSLRRALREPLGDTAVMHAFTDPYAALAHLDEHRIDLVMTDYRMPLMSGIQFLHFVRGLQPQAQRMIVSASTDVNAVISAINEVGVFRYVVKPWTTSLLVDDVRDALSQVAAARELRRLCDADDVKSGRIAPSEAEARRLEELEPGLTSVQWGPNGEVLMPPLPRRVH